MNSGKYRNRSSRAHVFVVDVITILLLVVVVVYRYIMRCLPVELVGGHAEEDSDNRVHCYERWSRQKLILETESVVVPLAEFCSVIGDQQLAPVIKRGND